MRRLERLSNAIAAGVSRQHHRSRGKPCDRCNIRFDRRLWSCVALTQACCASIAYRKMGENHFRGLRRPKAAAPETTTQSIVEVLEPGRSLQRAYLPAAQAYILISMPTGTSTILGALQAISRTPDYRLDCRKIHARRISKVVQACVFKPNESRAYEPLVETTSRLHTAYLQGDIFSILLGPRCARGFLSG
jgi:hypothetical protein